MAGILMSRLTIRNGEDVVSPNAWFSEIILDCNDSDAQVEANTTKRNQSNGHMVVERENWLEWRCAAFFRFLCWRRVIVVMCEAWTMMWLPVLMLVPQAVGVNCNSGDSDRDDDDDDDNGSCGAFIWNFDLCSVMTASLVVNIEEMMMRGRDRSGW